MKIPSNSIVNKLCVRQLTVFDASSFNRSKKYTLNRNVRIFRANTFHMHIHTQVNRKVEVLSILLRKYMATVLVTRQCHPMKDATFNLTAQILQIFYFFSSANSSSWTFTCCSIGEKKILIIWFWITYVENDEKKNISKEKIYSN